MFLKGKMSDALNASVMQGPTGPIGPEGTAAVQPFVAGANYLTGDLVQYQGGSSHLARIAFWRCLTGFHETAPYI